MTAPDHTTKPLENILRERGHPYMDTIAAPRFRQLSQKQRSLPGGPRRRDTEKLADGQIWRRLDDPQQIVAMGVELGAARSPVCRARRTHTMAVASPIPKRSAAPRAESPPKAALITRSRKSWL
jgi:hypothetical protein